MFYILNRIETEWSGDEGGLVAATEADSPEDALRTLFNEVGGYGPASLTDDEKFQILRWHILNVATNLPVPADGDNYDTIGDYYYSLIEISLEPNNAFVREYARFGEEPDEIPILLTDD